jgi:glycosyltransferase involved in cell wall biosynthesis
VNILYLVSATDNPLYEGQYDLHGRYMTFGQQSFIFDLVLGLAKRGASVTLAVEGASRFPLIEPLQRFCRIIDPLENRVPENVDLVLVDEGSDRLLEYCPAGVPAFRIVHNAATCFSARLEHRCQRFICLTERSLQQLSTRIPNEKLVLIHQGVDLERFAPRDPLSRTVAPQIRVLIYSRLDEHREPTIWRLLEQLEYSDARITLLGDGPKFWSICDRFGPSITPVHFIPCISIQNFLPNFDVVISSARGVMEALAMGLPALCGGFEYAGPVLRDNIRDHLKINITGFGMGVDPRRVCDDLKDAATMDSSSCRKLAEDYCSVQGFIDRLLETLSEIRADEAPAMQTATVRTSM